MTSGIGEQQREKRPQPSRVDPTAHIDPSAVIGPGVTVGPCVVIGQESVIGENTVIHAGVVIGRFCKLGRDNVLHPRVVLYDDCAFGDRVTVHAGAVIGADGFGYRTQQGRHVKVPQLGSVEVENDVEIGAGSAIDRGTFGPTRIGTGTKIDNLVQIGHNCQIGKHNLLGGQVGIAGSCVTGDHVTVAGRVGIADHLRIGTGAALASGSGVTGDVTEGTRVSGYPARPQEDVERANADAASLPALREEVRRISEHLARAGGASGRPEETNRATRPRRSSSQPDDQ